MSDIKMARAILDRLVAFPTVSSESNLDLVDWVEEFLDGHGVRATRVYDETGRKASLFAHVGPPVAGGVILSGHTDVVPVDPADWASDPFTVTERDGRLYGRGTCDMKGFDALALAALPLALERGVRRPLQIALSYDEEVGCLGAPSMIEAMAEALPRADLAVIGEPSMMKAVTGHKANMGFDLTFRGHEVHSSIMHQGVNAIMEAAELIVWANARNAENRARQATGADAEFDPPWTTLHVGEIRGGTAHNITAGLCKLGIDVRAVPGDDLARWEEAIRAEIARIEARMQAAVPGTGIDIAPSFRIPGLRPEEEGAAEALVRRLTGDNGQSVVSYGTEAGQFQEAGFSSVICGPGDIAQAHQPDEYLSLAQFEAGWQFMERLVDELAR